jgi:hypothetical protein
MTYGTQSIQASILIEQNRNLKLSKRCIVVEKSTREMIEEALAEAHILEGALEEPDEEHMLYTAQKLSGAPYSFIYDIYQNKP